MATIDGVAQENAIHNDITIGKRKRLAEDDGLVNGTTLTASTEQALESLHNVLEDLVQVLQEFDAASSVLNAEINTVSNKDHTPKRTKLASKTRPITILSQVNAKAYQNVDSFVEDIQSAIRYVQDQSASADDIASISKLEEEVISILNNEIKHGGSSIPRAESGSTTLLSSQKEDGSLDTNPNLVLTTPGFVYGLSQASKRLYSSFRLGSAAKDRTLQALPLEKLPNNITATTNKVEKIDFSSEKVETLKGLFQHAKHSRFDPPRVSSTSAKGPVITWSRQEEQKKTHRSKERQNSYDQNLITGQWLSYNIPPSMSELPFAEARRKRRDRALSTGEANIELTQQEKESVQKSQEAYKQAKSDSLFKSLYSTFAPTHDNSGAIIPKDVRSRHWWIKHGALRYLNSSAPELGSPFEDQNENKENGVESEESDTHDSHFNDMLENWIDPNLPKGLPREESDLARETEEILTEISDMLQTLSSYQRNRSLAINHKQQGSTTQNRTLVELLGDNSTPSSSECLLYDMLKESLASLIASLPPYAVAKLDGEQLGQLNISTKMLFQNPNTRGTTIGLESQVSNPQPTPRPQPPAPARIQPSQQVSTPTPSVSQGVGRPVTSIYSKYRVAPGTAGYQSYGNQAQMTSRISYGPQTPSTPTAPLTNGTRPTVNGYNSYGSQGSPQRPSSGSGPRPMPTAQTYSTYNAGANLANSARSASPQGNQNNMTGQGQRVNWNPSNGTIGQMFSADEVSRLEERQKAQMAAQAAQIRQDSSTPRPTSQAMSPISNGTPGG